MAEIKQITTIEEFLDFIGNSSSLNVVKLGAGFCGPCRVLEDTLKNLTQEDVDGVLLGEVDVDDEWFEDKAEELGIRGIPVLIAYKDGKELERTVGGISKDKVLEFFGRNK